MNIGIMALLGLVVFFGTGVILAAVEDYKDVKRRKMHPDLYRWFDEADKKGSESIIWYNHEIAPRKKQIDAILRDWDYYTAKEREQKEKELEELRNRIHRANIAYRVLEEEKETICDKIRKYVADKNLEWAKKWGW